MQIVMEDYGGINHQQQLLEILEHQALLDAYILKLIGLYKELTKFSTSKS